MSRHFILVDGKPVEEPDVLKWARWYEDNNASRVVEKTDIADGVSVSTVFLGLDHSFNGGAPVLYETMVFGGSMDGQQERYTALKHAINGHGEMVESARTAQERAATIPEGEPCGRCRKVRGDADHECPFASEIHDRHDLCNCCSDYTHECAMDI